MRAGLTLVAILIAGCGSVDTKPPKDDGLVRPREIQVAIREGVAYLVGTQNPDGSWGSAKGTTGFDLMASPPGSHDAFRIATSALVVMALMEAHASGEAIRRGVDYLLTTTQPRRPNPWEIYNVWADAYSVQALSRVYAEEKDPLRRAQVRAAVEKHLDMLQRMETMYGGWNYYDFDVGAQRPASSPTSFGTGATLVGFQEAKHAGLDVPEKLVVRAVRSVAECRNPDGSYLYDTGFKYYPRHPANQIKGTLGRAQAGNVALYVWGGRITREDLAAGVDHLFAEHKYIEMGRKRQFPHEAWYYNSGYYYYFGHYYAARAIELLEPAERPTRRAALAQCILPHQEPDGSWWDYYMFSYHKPYGTAFAVMTLLRCLETPFKS